MDVSAFDIAQRFINIREVSGSVDNPQVMAMLKLDMSWPEHDEVAWCSAFVNYICWILRLPRSKDLRARSWLQVGVPVDIKLAKPGFDIVVLKRGGDNEPGPEVIEAKGHVGFFAGIEKRNVLVLGGNQGDSVSIAPYAKGRILSIRRLREE